MLEEAMRWSKMDDGAKVRLAALQVASAALLRGETSASRSIANCRPMFCSKRSTMRRPRVAAARAHLHNLARRNRGEKLIAPLRSWWDRRLGAPGAAGEPVPSYLIERRDGDEHAASRGPEPVLALALSLVEDAAGTWDDEQNLLLITSDLLPRCGALLGIVLRKPEEHSPSVRERLLALVTRISEEYWLWRIGD